MIASPFRLATAALVLLATPAIAQAPAPAPPPIIAATPPPFDDALYRLAEILGGLHYLRRICDAGEGGLWRDQMQALIDAETPTPERRARFVDRFNRGYQGFQTVYLTCTPAAALTIDRYMAEGAKIARDVAARYGKEE